MAKRRRPLKKAVWQELQKTKADGCEICNERNLVYIVGRPNPLEIDHILPISKGGDNSIENLRWLCMYHNRSLSNGNHNFATESFRFSVKEEVGEGEG